MVDWLTVVVVCAAGIVAGWGAFYGLRDRAMDVPLLIGLGVVELLVLVQGIVGAVLTAISSRDIDAVTFIGYFIAGLCVPPLGGLWAFADRTRWGSVTVGAAALVVLIVQFRLLQVWSS